MTFLNNEGEYVLEARTQANLSAKCLGCNHEFKQNADLGVYGLTFCEPCIKGQSGRMPAINYVVNKRPE